LLQMRHRLPNVVNFSFPSTWCEYLTDSYIQNMAKDYRFRPITVDISSRDDVSDEMLSLIGESEVRWKELNISQCANVTPRGIDSLSAKCPNLLLRLSFYDELSQESMESFTIKAKEYMENIVMFKAMLDRKDIEYKEPEVLRSLEKHSANVHEACDDFPYFQALLRLKQSGRIDITNKWFEAIDGDGVDDGVLRLKPDDLESPVSNDDYKYLVALLSTEHADKIVEIDLCNNNLEGEIPPTFGRMRSLRALKMSHNRLKGAIPAELGNCQNLEEIWIDNNNLSGAMPKEMGNLGRLRVLCLQENALIDNIPAEIGKCRMLQEVNLSCNKLTGSLPGQLGDLSELRILYLQFNKFSGSLPAQICNLKKLEELNLTRNARISGAIPSNIGQMSGLVQLYLSECQFEGSIPEDIVNLKNLQVFECRLNKLSGSIPTKVGTMSSLRRLNLGANKLTGSIPKTLAELKGIKSLVLYGNQLEGCIPGELGQCSGLEEVNFGMNKLDGKVPSSDLAKCSDLVSLNLVFNRLNDPETDVRSLKRDLPRCKIFV